MKIEQKLGALIEFMQSARKTGYTSMLNSIRPIGRVTIIFARAKDKRHSRDFSMDEVLRKEFRGLERKPVFMDNEVILDIMTESYHVIDRYKERDELFRKYIAEFKMSGIHQSREGMLESVKYLENKLANLR